MNQTHLFDRGGAGRRDSPAATVRTNTEIMERLGERLRRHRPYAVVTCARGSSDHAATFAKYLLETRVGILTSSAAPSVSSVYSRKSRSARHGDVGHFPIRSEPGPARDRRQRQVRRRHDPRHGQRRILAPGAKQPTTPSRCVRDASKVWRPRSRTSRPWRRSFISWRFGRRMKSCWMR